MTTLHGINCCLRDGCFNRIENHTTGLCATHSREARKAAQPKTKARRTRISKQSEEGKERMAIYQAIKSIWIQQPENYFCDVCGTEKAIEPHHKAGRNGDLLYDVRKWLPVCRRCHEALEKNPAIAYQRGWSLLRTATEPHSI